MSLRPSHVLFTLLALMTVSQAWSQGSGDTAGTFLVQDAKLAYQVRTDLIESETEEIFADFHMWDASGLALDSLAQLCRKAREGVRVRIVNDGFAATKVGLMSNAALLSVVDQDCVSPSGQKLEIRFWNPARKDVVNFVLHPSLLHRSHEKILFVKSQRVAYEGDRNWQNVNFRGDDKRKGYSYLSTDIVVRGSQASVVEKHLEDVWTRSIAPKHFEFAADEVASVRADFLKRVHASEKDPSAQAAAAANLASRWQSVRSVEYVHDGDGKLERKEDVYLTTRLTELIASAQRQIFISTPYLRLSPPLFDAIAGARKKGLTVTLMTGKAKSLIATSREYGFQNKDVSRLRKIGVTVLEPVSDDDLHMKSIIIDRQKFFVGTHNLDMRSTYLDLESGFIVDDAATAEQMQNFLEKVAAPYHLRRSLKSVLVGPFIRTFLKIRKFEKQL